MFNLPLKLRQHKQQDIMKTSRIYLVLAGMILVGTLISCGAGRTAGCDAYGQEIVVEQNQDLASK